MSVRFVIGRAGSGKTHHCLSAIQTQLRSSALFGPKLLLIVPEQASLQMERALLSCNTPIDDEVGPLIRASHRGEVLSFRRLAARLLQSSPAVSRRALTPSGRSMILRHLLHQHARDLQYYANVDRWPGFISQLSQTIVELFHEGVVPHDLTEKATESSGAAELEPRTKKLADLNLIYAAYLKRLNPDLLDPSQHLALAVDLVETCPWLAGAGIWVDGFAGFTGLERTLLTRLARRAESMNITLLADPDHLPAPSNTKSADPYDLFNKTIRTYHELHQSLTAAAIPIVDPLILNPPHSPRFRANDSLSQLERAINKNHPTNVDPHNIRLIEAADRRTEVEYAVSCIASWVRDYKYRYRDTAIIVRDMAAYHDLIAEAFDRRQIPYFIDRRQPAAHHPLAELIRSLIAIAVESFSLSSVRTLLRTGLVGLTHEEVDVIENYVLATGINALDPWQKPWTRIPAARFGQSEESTIKQSPDELRCINHLRLRILDLLKPWLKETARQPRRTGESWSALLIHTIEQLKVGSSLADWTAQAEDDGDLTLGEEHRQVWRDVAEFLDGLAIAFEDEEIALGELPSIVQSGLADLTLGLAPPMIDQVLVGSIERSRHPDIRAAVVLGLNEGHFPARLEEDAILNDDDRVFLQHPGIDIGPPVRERVVDERMLFYVAVTRPSEQLVISYSLANENGRALRPSEYIDDLQRVMPKLQVTYIDDPTTTAESWSVLSPRDLGRRLAAAFRLIEEGAPDRAFQSRARVWRQVYEIARQRDDLRTILKQSLAGLAAPRSAAIAPDLAAALYPQPLETSISRLETHAACPFKHFAQYGLNLRERTTAAFQAVDIGSIHHAILEDLITGWASDNTALKDITADQLSADIVASYDRICAKTALNQTVSTARDRYIADNISNWTHRAVERQRPITGRGAYRPRATEVRFGIKHENALPALELITGKGRQVLLRGVIDRVDLAEVADELLGIVIDYKTTRNIKLDITRVFHGLSLQLVSYLLALQASGQTLAGRRIRPAGALYAPLKLSYTSVDHPDDAKPQHAHGKWSGLIDFSYFKQLDPDTNSKYSPSFNVYIKANGELGIPDRSDAVDSDEFAGVLNHTLRTLANLADDILDGNIRVAPYNLNRAMPCSWCDMRSVCRFEFDQPSDIRILEGVKRVDALTRMLENPGEEKSS